MDALWIEWLFGTLYALLGAGAWGIFLLLMVKGRSRMSLLELPVARQSPPVPPPLTVLIPAKDEGERIADCLRSVLAQDYPAFQVIAINDRSADGTGPAMDAAAASDPRLTVIHVAPGDLADGWVGKTAALHRAMRGVDAEPSRWLAFIDSDVVLRRPDVLSSVINVCEAKDFDLLSLLMGLECRGFWERLIIPLAGAATGTMYAVALTNVMGGKQARAFANGQFLAVRRGAYDAAGGHAAVRGVMSEDLAMARKIQSAGGRVRIAWAVEWAAVRMYAGLAEIFRGWGRNFYAGSLGRPWRILAAMAFILVCGFSLFAAVGWGLYRAAHPLTPVAGWGWFGFAALHLGLMLTALGLTYKWSGNRPALALLFPLGFIMMLGVFAKALWNCATRKVTWRGTSYTHRMRPEAA